MRLNIETYNQAIKKIPVEIWDVMSSEETTEKTILIAKKYNLHVDKIGILSIHIGMVMTGLLKPKDFIPELVVELKLDPETANKVAQEVNEQIFKPIREALKKIHGLDGSTPLNEEVIAKTPTKPATPGQNFDDRIGKYLSTNKTDDNLPLSPRPYTQDPYREHPN